MVIFQGVGDANSLHSSLRYIRGSASDYECVDCNNEAYDWSWIHGTDKNNFVNYEPRCRSCHCIYDGTINNIPRACFTKLTERDVIDIRDMYHRGISRKNISELFCISERNIGLIVTRRTWKHI